jgi:hypothetical protein
MGAGVSKGMVREFSFTSLNKQSSLRNQDIVRMPSTSKPPNSLAMHRSFDVLPKPSLGHNQRREEKSKRYDSNRRINMSGHSSSSDDQDHNVKRQQILENRRNFKIALEQVGLQMLDEMFLEWIPAHNDSQTGTTPFAQVSKSNIIINIVKESITQIRAELKHQEQFKLALKMAASKIVKCVSRDMITDVIQRSTDAVYKFEDDSITLADSLLKSILREQLQEVLVEAAEESEQYSHSRTIRDRGN